MAKARDIAGSAEARVVEALRQQRLTRQLTIGTLASRTGISSDRVQRVLAPNGQRIHLDELIALAEALGVTRSDLARLMWPGGRLTDDFSDGAGTGGGAPGFCAAVDPEQAAAVELTALISRSRNWSYEVTPVFQGPSSDVRVRITNRVVVAPATREIDIVGHDALRARFLSDFPQLPLGVSFTWQPSGADHDTDRSIGLDLARDARLYFACAAFAAERPPSVVPVDLRGIASRGVVITALRAITRSLRLSALVARALGWGLISTTRTGRQVSRQAMDDPRQSSAKEILYANLVLGELLATSRPHTVVNHVGTPVTDADGQILDEHSLLAAQRDQGPFIVYLAESDELLERSLERPVNARGDASRFSLGQLVGWRDQLREHVSQLQDEGRGLVIDSSPFWASEPSMDPARESEVRWRDTCQQARAILHELFHLSGMRRSTFASRDPEARALLAFESPVIWH